jgi:hypothetical protein
MLGLTKGSAFAWRQPCCPIDFSDNDYSSTVHYTLPPYTRQ